MSKNSICIFSFYSYKKVQQILHSTIPILLLCNTTGTMQGGAKDNDYPRAKNNDYPICIFQNTHFQFSDSWLSPRLSHSRLLPRLSKEYKIQQQQKSSVLFDTTTLWTTQKFILAQIFYIHRNSSHIPIGSLFFFLLQ